jgi:hypothetical protein
VLDPGDLDVVSALVLQPLLDAQRAAGERQPAPDPQRRGRERDLQHRGGVARLQHVPGEQARLAVIAPAHAGPVALEAGVGAQHLPAAGVGVEPRSLGVGARRQVPPVAPSPRRLEEQLRAARPVDDRRDVAAVVGQDDDAHARVLQRERAAHDRLGGDRHVASFAVAPPSTK